MLIAMFIASCLCILIGIFPEYLYAILPYEVKYDPYKIGHVISQLQLLIFAILAFIFLVKFKLYPEEIKSTVINTDWIYRKMLPGIGLPVIKQLDKIIIKLYSFLKYFLKKSINLNVQIFGSPNLKNITPNFASLVLISSLLIMLLVGV